QEHRGLDGRGQRRRARRGHRQIDMARHGSRVGQGEAGVRLRAQAAQGLQGAPVIALLLASQVARVVVFPDRAQVTRSAPAQCGTQAVKVEFNSLPPSADPSSLRATISEGGVESVDVIEEPRVTAFSAEVNTLEEQLRRLGAQLAALHDAREKAQSLDRLAGHLEDMSASLISTEIVQQPDVKAWRAAFAQTLQTRLEAARQRADAIARERDLQRQAGDARRKLARLGQARDRRERRAEVLVSCPSGQTARVEPTSLVRRG